MSFEGKTVMVTGAAGNLGRAVADAFSGLGASLVLIDLKDKGDEKGLFIPTDLLDQKSVAAAVEKAIARFGRIDVLCNIAGGFRMGPPVHETADADWNFLLDLNARTVLHTARAVVPRMLAPFPTTSGGRQQCATASSPERPRRRCASSGSSSATTSGW